MSKKGKVYIIGGGPGDPGLITVRGVECLRKADVVVYDYLVGREILDYAPKDARLIYVGKKGGEHTVSQHNLNQILVEEAVKGNIVARLKGGDPFIFGRGGEEAQVLAQAGIPFEVVPGVTSAVAVPAYAGIPLTHRSFTSSVTFVTGHEDPVKEQSRVDWKSLNTDGTIVFLMGVRNLSRIVERLTANGKDPETPAALIRWGTTPDQETVTGTLKNIVTRAEERHFSPPAIFVVGDVVTLREELSWFENKPLSGKGIVITRPEEQAGDLAALLREAGARVIYFPTIKIVPPDRFDDLDRAIDTVATYDWIIFTSANGVKFFFERLRELGKDLRDMKGPGICAIGPATAETIGNIGLRVDIVPDEYISEGVVRAFEGQNLQGKRVLLPRAEIARDIIPDGLSKRGATVDVVTAYRTANSGRKRNELYDLIKQNKVDVVTFTSPSTVTNFIDIIGRDEKLPEYIKIACIGPVTSASAQEAGLNVDIMQGPYVISGLVRAMIKALNNNE
ncbi:MAG: uroporphyrinogen-III C-methyltransferase [Deltaproteobacteria bacterium]|nr:uroporphyrinogen-III C-methyltransferase [Deltaproteobacteria bacterium]